MSLTAHQRLFLGLHGAKAASDQKENQQSGVSGGKDTGLNVGHWLHAQRKPGQSIVGVGVARETYIAESVLAWDAEEELPWDPDHLRQVADDCQALASEARLGILRGLVQGPKSTSELLAMTGIDRGQLYHHLRDLFVQGFVEQPERGRYAATMRGEIVLLVAWHLPLLGPEPKGVSEPEFDV
jgi:DNA-binding transcriptional ArsR family regulator